MVHAILPHGQQQGFLELRLIDPPVVDDDFGAGPGIQSIEELRIIQEHGGLIILTGNAVIDIGKGEGLGKPAPHLKTPSGQMRRMRMASCTDSGIVNFSFSNFLALVSVLMIGIRSFLRELRG